MVRLPFAQILEALNGSVIVTDLSGLDTANGPRIIFVNTFFCDLMGYTKEDMIGQSLHCLSGPNTDKNTLRTINQALYHKESIEAELLNYSKEGEPHWLSIAISPIFDKNGNLQYFAALQHDISKRKTLEYQATQKCFTDPLTHLYNRTLFFERAPEIIAAMQRYQEPFGLLIIDINHFKQLNHNEGYEAGDKALCHVAKACKTIFRKSDLICRYGGNKFAIIVERNENSESLSKKAKQLEGQIKHATQSNISVSIGGTVSKLYEDSIEDVLKRAEKALYKIKSTQDKNAFYIH